MARSRTDAANATAVAVRNGRTHIKNIRVEQRASAAPQLFLQVFNTNAPTVGTTAPEVVVPVPAGQANMDLVTLDLPLMAKRGGLELGTGFAYAVTTTHDGLTAPTAGQEPTVIIDYEPLG